MSFLRSSWLLLPGVVAGITPAAHADDPCAAFTWDVKQERELFANPQSPALGRDAPSAPGIVPDRSRADVTQTRSPPTAQLLPGEEGHERERARNERVTAPTVNAGAGARARSQALKARAAKQGVIRDEEHSGTDSRDEHAIEIEPGHARHSEDMEEPASDNCSAYPKKYVQDDTLSAPIDDFAGNEAGNKPKDDPRNN